MLPVRMLNEYVYCPRLFALEHVHGQWAESADTVRGSQVHRRVDKPDPREVDPDASRPTRSVRLSDEALGFTAVIDLVETDDGAVVPVDYKQGRPAPNEHGAWDPERVQVCAQVLLLRAHGYTCHRGVLYFAKARRRIEVIVDDELVELTLAARDRAMDQAQSSALPEPLVDSPKCPRCSLVGICLPDEQNALDGAGGRVRPLLPARDDALPVYVQRNRGRVGKRGGELVVKEEKSEVQRVPLEQVSHVVLLGNVQISTQLLHELARRDVPVAFHSHAGWYRGSFSPSSGTNVFLRIQQFRAASVGTDAMALARAFVRAKIHNQRVYLRRNGNDLPGDALARMAELKEQAGRATDPASLLGIEGGAARIYFASFSSMLRGSLGTAHPMGPRSRRPTKDPVNACLNFAYACLVREITQILQRVGFDPYVGFLHQPRYNRPALSLDLMEEFRPVIAESAVVSAINNGALQDEHFVIRRTGVSLTPVGRARLIKAYEQRLEHVITHPAFGTKLSYRRIIEVQARLLGKVLLGDLDDYPGFIVR